MSIVNPRTGRHEDDLYAKLIKDGTIPLSDLIAHLNECVVEAPEAYPANVRAPVKMATLTLEALVNAGVLPNDHPLVLG